VRLRTRTAPVLWSPATRPGAGARTVADYLRRPTRPISVLRPFAIRSRFPGRVSADVLSLPPHARSGPTPDAGKRASIDGSPTSTRRSRGAGVSTVPLALIASGCGRWHRSFSSGFLVSRACWIHLLSFTSDEPPHPGSTGKVRPATYRAFRRGLSEAPARAAELLPFHFSAASAAIQLLVRSGPLALPARASMSCWRRSLSTLKATPGRRGAQGEQPPQRREKPAKFYARASQRGRFSLPRSRTPTGTRLATTYASADATTPTQRTPARPQRAPSRQRWRSGARQSTR